MKKVFIDGSAGTTGLRIYERIRAREDMELITLADEVRKDPAARKEAIWEADIAFLCLPDDAAREAVELAEGADTCIIDTSTAHRTAEGWTYGFPEIGGRYEEVKNSKRIANPGCHASGFISLVAPLIENGLLSKDAMLSCFSLTGYTGGGKKMIAQYETEKTQDLEAPRMYGLTQSHKHLFKFLSASIVSINGVCIGILTKKLRLRDKAKMSKYDLIKDELDSVFKRLAPQAFYERIYKKELQERSAFKDGACNGIMTILNKNNVKNFMIKQDLKVLNVALSRYEKQKKKLESIEKSGKSPAYTERAKSFLDFVIVSSCGYMGKRKCLDMVRECYEICIDLDSLKLNSIQVLKDICDKNILPLPTLITLSGNGIHLHYVFDKPLNVENRHNQSILNEIKRALTYHWWNPYLTDLNDKRAIQYQSIFQSFRMVGTFTKDQRETLGY
ncbi:MAG: N-acetyl-gamma-glutamyl-phosphate reductase [Enterococcus sp.]|nr:N-acetyl-gamma-glutamyl-phosphate reductase [Enterococcus sp.]